MRDELLLTFATENGGTEQLTAPLDAWALCQSGRSLVGVSDNITQLAYLKGVLFNGNAFVEIPACVLALTQLTTLNFGSNRLAALPPAIGRLTALSDLILFSNQLTELPREIGLLCNLKVLALQDNALVSLPSELGDLPLLIRLQLQGNRLSWLPLSLDRLPRDSLVYVRCRSTRHLAALTDTASQLHRNPVVATSADLYGNSRAELPEIFAATSALAMIREPASTLLIALQPLFLHALVLVEILDAAWDNNIRMAAKWDLVVCVKHWHQRRGIER